MGIVERYTYSGYSIHMKTIFSEGAKDTSPILMQVGLPIVDTQKCARVCGGNSIHADTMICAGSQGGKDTC
jgi:hypothetical protein